MYSSTCLLPKYRCSSPQLCPFPRATWTSILRARSIALLQGSLHKSWLSSLGSRAFRTDLRTRKNTRPVPGECAYSCWYWICETLRICLVRLFFFPYLFLRPVLITDVSFFVVSSADNSPREFIDLSEALETVGTSAYAGAIQYLSNDVGLPYVLLYNLHWYVTNRVTPLLLPLSSQQKHVTPRGSTQQCVNKTLGTPHLRYVYIVLLAICHFSWLCFNRLLSLSTKSTILPRTSSSLVLAPMTLFSHLISTPTLNSHSLLNSFQVKKLKSPFLLNKRWVMESIFTSPSYLARLLSSHRLTRKTTIMLWRFPKIWGLRGQYLWLFSREERISMRLCWMMRVRSLSLWLRFFLLIQEVNTLQWDGERRNMTLRSDFVFRL